MRVKLLTPPGISQLGTLTSGSATVTGLTDTTNVQVGSNLSGVGVPLWTRVLSVDSATQVTLTANATRSGTPTLAIGQEPLSLADAKLFLRVDIPDDDALIARLIRSAREFCETHLRQALITQTWVLYLDSFPSAGGYYNRAIREIWPSLGGMPSGLGFYPGMVPNSTGLIDIPKPPLQSITSVQYYDMQGVLQTIDPAVYNASLGMVGRIQPQYSKVWPISRPTIDSVQITFVAGYGDTPDTLPDNVILAMSTLVTHFYENRGESSAEIPDAVLDLLNTSDHGSYA